MRSDNIKTAIDQEEIVRKSWERDDLCAQFEETIVYDEILSTINL